MGSPVQRHSAQYKRIRRNARSLEAMKRWKSGRLKAYRLGRGPVLQSSSSEVRQPPSPHYSKVPAPKFDNPEVRPSTIISPPRNEKLLSNQHFQHFQLTGRSDAYYSRRERGGKTLVFL